MKKILLFTMLVLLCVTTLNDIHAQEVSGTTIKNNLLDLSSFIQDGQLYGYSNKIIDLEIDQTYTFVMSYEYLGHFEDEILASEFEYEDAYGFQPFAYSYEMDLENFRYYVEFINQCEGITIFRMPYLADNSRPNYEVMLYEGSYDDFEGFEPYVPSDYKQIDYGTISMDYDSRYTQAQVLSFIKAKDPNNQEINYEVIADEFTNSSQLPGDYEMTLMAEINNIKKFFILEISVFDTTAPEIHGLDVYEVMYGDNVSIDDIISNYTVTDNVDELDYTDIVITNDLYSSSTDVGSYNVEIEVTDLSGNTGYKIFEVSVLDDMPPVIKGPEKMVIYTSDQAYTDAYILSQFSATDNVDEELTLNIDTNDYQQTMIAGVYHVTITSTDLQGNTATFDTYIHVIENRGPSFETTEPIIEVTTTELMTENEIIIYLKNYMTQQSPDIENVEILYNEYLDHEKQAGSYYVYFNYELDGEIYNSRVLMEVAQATSIIDYWYYGLTILAIGIVTYFLIKNKKKKI